MANEMTHFTPRVVIPHYSRAFPPFQYHRSAPRPGPSQGNIHAACPRLSTPAGVWKFNVNEMLESSPSVIAKGTCGVCCEYVEGAASILMPACAHVFCKDCLRSYVLVKLEERRYPVVCPVCVTVHRDSHNCVEDDLIERLGIPPEKQRILVELQLSQYSRVLHCPKCKQTMNVDREDYLENRVVTCPLSGCHHRWCTECEKEISPAETKHHCKDKKLDKLMRRKGWRYCPGCRTPIQKESGCNHMTCRSPGCNVHFCYKCGNLIFDPAVVDGSSSGLSVALTSHFRRCRQHGRFMGLRRLARRCIRIIM